MPLSERFRPGLNGHLATKARAQMVKAVASGALKRPTFCTECSADGRIQGHHDDYAKPMDITWLCVSCHRQRHFALQEEESVQLKVSISRELKRSLKYISVIEDRPLRSVFIQALTEYLNIEPPAPGVSI